MKLIFVRLISDKQPVCVFSKSAAPNKLELFWKIDEWINPRECEIKEVDFKHEIHIGWPNFCDYDDDMHNYEISNSGELSEITGGEFVEIFSSHDGWGKPRFPKNVYK